MGILIGMDEAGYGPNLGPLVVAATAWGVVEDAGCRMQGAGCKSYLAPPSSVATLAPAPTRGLSQVDLYRQIGRAHV